MYIIYCSFYLQKKNIKHINSSLLETFFIDIQFRERILVVFFLISFPRSQGRDNGNNILNITCFIYKIFLCLFF